MARKKSKIKLKKNNTHSTLKAVSLSVFLTLLIVGAGGYFGLPYIFPNLTADLSKYDDNIENTDEGILLQSIMVESWDFAYIEDSSTTNYELVADMNLSISITAGSKIRAQFSTPYVLEIYDNMQGLLSFWLNLTVVGVKKKMAEIYHYSDIATGIYTRLSSFAYLEVFTDPLPQGTYEIRLEWISESDRAGDNILMFSRPSFFNYTRSLVVQEFKS
ncbi:hypothetical protein NEF87_003289 [Candidatus Lokiarchaeum ossiferum]|uniref:Uncharacterized protein n=1 Tax=Candidatus Lokiarchaeum ossiferum TaxID=2951803 RepID=A0ABY6HU13_9ARCH|nr:hypothetical protein NEF87_003289 [Candidatus Lokiarchaeum sp. B-35]